MDGPGIESRDIPHLSRLALGPTHPPIQWVLDFFWCKKRPVRDADPSPSSSTVVKKEYSFTSTPPMDRTVCSEPQCLYKGAHYIFYMESHSDVKINYNRKTRIAAGVSGGRCLWMKCGQQHFSISARSSRVCLCCCQVTLKPLS
jgi:hypothetical protein